MTSRRLLLAGPSLAVPLLTVLLLAGCSGAQSAADRSYAGLPESGGVPPEAEINAEPIAVWIEEDESFAVTTWGSSSCPAEPTSIETSDAGVVDIEFDTVSDGPCTADLAPNTSEFTVPGDVATSPLVITVRGVSEQPLELVLD